MKYYEEMKKCRFTDEELRNHYEDNTKNPMIRRVNRAINLDDYIVNHGDHLENPFLQRKDNQDCIIFGRYFDEDQPLYMCIKNIPDSYPIDTDTYYFSEEKDRTLRLVKEDEITEGMTVRYLHLYAEEIKHIVENKRYAMEDLLFTETFMVPKLFVCSYPDGFLRRLDDDEIDMVTDICFTGPMDHPFAIEDF